MFTVVLLLGNCICFNASKDIFCIYKSSPAIAIGGIWYKYALCYILSFLEIEKLFCAEEILTEQ